MKWYSEKISELENIAPIFSVCGDDCAVCPRYLAQTNDELKETAEFWYRVGWRDHIVSNEEIRCLGCGTREGCSFNLLPCTNEHNVKRCKECNEFECDKVRRTYEGSEKKREQCKKACESPEEYKMLCRAFYEKEVNMNK